MVLVSDFANGESMQQLKGCELERKGKEMLARPRLAMITFYHLEKIMLNLHEKKVPKKCRMWLAPCIFLFPVPKEIWGFLWLTGLMAGSETNISLR